MEVANQPTKRSRMGIVTYSLAIHQKNRWAGRHQGLSPALALLEEAHLFGAGGIQVDLTAADAPQIEELRRRTEQRGMFIEASIQPPKDAKDVERFETDVRLVKSAGATLARTVIFPGRRYEQFQSMDDYRDHERLALESLQLAAPVLSRERFRLAVENHKDQRIAEKLTTLKRVGSEFIGVCIDFGNNFTLLEDPMETVRALAPVAMTAHIKDQTIHPYEDGFLFGDAALGEGILDLPTMVRVLRDAQPGIRFSLETITRDALKVPVLTSAYWATLSDTPAHELARTWGVIKAHSQEKRFLEVSTLAQAEQLNLESQNIRRSFDYAHTALGL